MNGRETRIERLSLQLNKANWQGNKERARSLATKLETMLGDPTPECLQRYAQSWIMIHESRDNLEEAIRLEEKQIHAELAELQSGELDPYPNLVADTAESVHDGLYLQAMRYRKLGNLALAINCLKQAYSLEERYKVSSDNDVRALLAELTDNQT